MSRSEILNYDPLRLNRAENIIELQEIIVSGDENTRVKSLLIPTCKLTGKTKEEIELIFQRTYWAFNIIDISRINFDAALINGVKNDLASRYTGIFVANLAIVYFERLARGDGKDPEMDVVEHCEVEDEWDIAACDRLVKHMRSRTEAGLISYFGEHLDLVTAFCREAIGTILGQVTLSILEEKGYDYKMTQEERASVIRQSSWWRWRDYLELAAERWASVVLNRMNPAGMPFLGLQRIVRSGLDVLLRRSVDDVGKILQKVTKRVADEKELLLRISADGKEASVKLSDGKEIIIKLSEESPGSQESMIELLSSPGRVGRPPSPNKKEKLQEYIEFAERVHKRRDLAEFLSEFAQKNSNGTWVEMLKSDYEFEHYCREYVAKGHDVAVIMEAAKTVYDYHSNTDLMTKDEFKWKRATSALGIAQIIASLEMKWKDEDGSPLNTTKLRDRYLMVARRWKIKPNKGR